MTRSLPRDSPVAKISAIRLNSGSMSLTWSTIWFPLRVSLELFRLSLNDLTPRMRERFCFLSEIVVEPWYPNRPPLRCLQWSPSPSIHTLGYSPLFEWGLDLLTCFKNRIEQKGWDVTSEIRLWKGYGFCIRNVATLSSHLRLPSPALLSSSLLSIILLSCITHTGGSKQPCCGQRYGNGHLVWWGTETLRPTTGRAEACQLPHEKALKWILQLQPTASL